MHLCHICCHVLIQYHTFVLACGNLLSISSLYHVSQLKFCVTLLLGGKYQLVDGDQSWK